MTGNVSGEQMVVNFKLGGGGGWGRLGEGANFSLLPDSFPLLPESVSHLSPFSPLRSILYSSVGMTVAEGGRGQGGRNLTPRRKRGRDGWSEREGGGEWRKENGERGREGGEGGGWREARLMDGIRGDVSRDREREKHDQKRVRESERQYFCKWSQPYLYLPQ